MARRPPWARLTVVLVTGIAVALPLAIVIYQAFLDAPFFQPSAKGSLSAFRFVFADADFHRAVWTNLILAFGMTAIAVPVGSAMAFLMVRTDLPGRNWLEPVIVIPVFVSPMVLGFGYIVAMGPVGFLTLWWQQTLGPVPWDIYSLKSLVVIAGLTHVPMVYLYTSSSLRSLASDIEEAALIAGAGTARVAMTVSLPMVWPAILSSGVLRFSWASSSSAFPSSWATRRGFWSSRPTSTS